MTSLIFAGSVAAGMAAWSAAASVGTLLAMLAGILIWGFGFSAINSPQQARLVPAAPALSAGAVALNPSVLYIGQAIGSTAGGILFERGRYLSIGYIATAIMVAGLGVLLTTRPRMEGSATDRQRIPLGKAAGNDSGSKHAGPADHGRETLDASLVNAGVPAILTSTSFTGFLVQAWVT